MKALQTFQSLIEFYKYTFGSINIYENFNVQHYINMKLYSAISNIVYVILNVQKYTVNILHNTLF